MFPLLERAYLRLGEAQLGGKQLANYLLAKAMKLKVKMMFKTKVIELTTNAKTGAVDGVGVKGKIGS